MQLSGYFLLYCPYCQNSCIYGEIFFWQRSLKLPSSSASSASSSSSAAAASCDRDWLCDEANSGGLDEANSSGLDEANSGGLDKLTPVD